MPDRRGFLKTLIGAGLVAAADPERLLWAPGEKTIFVPRPSLPSGLFFHRGAFVMTEFDLAQNKFISRMDVLYGFQRVYDGNLSAMMEVATGVDLVGEP